MTVVRTVCFEFVGIFSKIIKISLISVIFHSTMSGNKIALALFADYVQSSGKLRELSQQTKEIDSEIKEANTFISELKIKYNSIGHSLVNDSDASNDISRHEDMSKFLESGPPKLLLPDMQDDYEMDLDINQSIEKFELIAEKIKQSEMFNRNKDNVEFNFSPELQCDLAGFSSSLEQVCQRLANVRAIKSEDYHQRNELLEEKLAQLCQDVELITKMVQSKTQLSKCNEEWNKNQINVCQLQYTEIVNNLLGTINDVTLMFLDYKKSLNNY